MDIASQPTFAGLRRHRVGVARLYRLRGVAGIILAGGVSDGTPAAGMPAIHYRTPQQLAADLAVRGVRTAPQSGRIAVL